MQYASYPLGGAGSLDDVKKLITKFKLLVQLLGVFLFLKGSIECIDKLSKQRNENLYINSFI